MTDERHQLEIALGKHHHRMMAAGIPYSDVEGVRAQAPSTWLEWLDYWTGRALAYDELATGAHGRGEHVTASAHWVRTALCHHFGQFMVYEHPEEKAQARAAAAVAYRRAAPAFSPGATFLSVPTPVGPVPVVLRTPGGGPAPCVILVPGLEATKEELHGWEGFYLDRGMAVAAIDGPGQGELADRALVPADYVVAVSAVVDRLSADTAVDATRIGIMGVSLGGLLASMVAAHEHRLVAAAEVAGTFDTASRWERANALSRRGHQFITKSPDEETTRRVVADWTMAAVAADIECPFLVVHGELDVIVPLDQAEAYAKAVPHAELVVVPGGNHVCNNLPHIVRPQVADWMRRSLDAAGGAR